MPVTLEQILTTTRGTLPGLRARREALERAAAAVGRPPSFRAALRGKNVAVIAEVKRRSPSAGSIREDLDPAERAERYARHGAAAISVLTDGPFFGGSLEDLRAAAGRTRVPVLRKDFILDELQILEARAAGAAAILLIVRALPQPRLAALLEAARATGLDALVEVHQPRGVAMALDAGADILGINSRDLDTFRIDTTAAWRPASLHSARPSGGGGERHDQRSGRRDCRGGRRGRGVDRHGALLGRDTGSAPRRAHPRTPPCPLAVARRGRRSAGLPGPRTPRLRCGPERRSWASFLLVDRGGWAPRVAAEITAASGGVPVFGVYGDQSVDEILQLSREAGLAGAQLHGPYRRDDAARLRAAGLIVWRVVRIATPDDLDALNAAVAEADAVLVEPLVPHLAGGSGVSLDLAVAREARGRLAGRHHGAGRRPPAGDGRGRRGPRSTGGGRCKFRGGAPAGHQGP